MGLHYDVQLFPDVEPNQRSPLLELYTSKANVDYSALQPRLGIAWNFTPSTVLRIGGGVFYARPANATLQAARRTNGIREQQFNCGPTDGGLCAPLVYPDVFFAQQVNRPGPIPVPGARQPVVHNPSGDQCTPATRCAAR